jgi:hypothetical protein
METRQRARADGAFHWNAGAWFGAQLGSTLWLFILGAVLSARDRSTSGTAIIALAVAANGIGLILWEHRDRMRPYPAIEALVATVGCAGFVAFILLDGTSTWGLAAAQTGGSRPPYPVLLVFPAMMGLFALQEHAARRAQRRRGDGSLIDGHNRS